jgi:transposase
MTNGRVEVITSERRRPWSAADQQELVLASLEPGASVSAMAREAGIHPRQLYGWRPQVRAQQGIGFAPVRIVSEIAPADLAGRGAIEIEFASGVRMRITGAVEVAMVTAAVAALSKVGGDDPESERGAGVDCDRPHRHAARHELVGTAGAGSLQV